MWREIEMDGCVWEVRTVARDDGPQGRAADGEELLEFRPRDGGRPPRRVAVAPAAGALADLADADLAALYRAARPIGGDHYGRPGKAMGDVAG